MRHLVRLLGSEVIHPQIAGIWGSIMREEQTRATGGKGRVRAGDVIESFGQPWSQRAAGDHTVDEDFAVAVHVDRPRCKPSVMRELAGADLPALVRQPGDLLAGDFNQGSVAVAVQRVGGDQHAPAVGPDVAGRENLVSLVWSEVGGLTAVRARNHDVRVPVICAALGVDDPLAILRPDRIGIAPLFGSVCGQMADFPGRDLHHVNLMVWRLFRPYTVRELLAVGRPGWTVFGDLGGVGQIYYLSVARRDQKDVVLLITIFVGSVGDPAGLRRPRRRRLRLVAD